MLGIDYVITITVIAAAIVAFAQYLFKKNITKFSMNLSGFVGIAKNRGVVAGVIAYVVGLVFYLYALDSGQLSFVYPAFASTFVFVVAIARFKLGERVGLARIAGVIMIILGITLVAFSL